MPRKLTQAIKASGLHRNSIAAKAGITVTHLYNLEAGRNGPSLRVARRVAAALGLSVDEVFPSGLRSAS